MVFCIFWIRYGAAEHHVVEQYVWENKPNIIMWMYIRNSLEKRNENSGVLPNCLHTTSLECDLLETVFSVIVFKEH